ncbi:hypothetical protein Dimus_018286 [Dionaea muscipula]
MENKLAASRYPWIQTCGALSMHSKSDHLPDLAKAWMKMSTATPLIMTSNVHQVQQTCDEASYHDFTLSCCSEANVEPYLGGKATSSDDESLGSRWLLDDFMLRIYLTLTFP